jgi:hypothetical protein
MPPSGKQLVATIMFVCAAAVLKITTASQGSKIKVLYTTTDEVKVSYLRFKFFRLVNFHA